MTLDDIARKLDTIDTRLSTLERKVDDGFSASGSAMGSLRSGLVTLEEKLDTLEEKVDSLEEKVDSLEEKLDDSSRASQIRDEELHRLTRFGLEADGVIANSINRRLDESNHRHDEQITLIKDMIRQQHIRP